MGTKKGIGYSPLSEKVYLGKQDKTKGMWIGEKEDITNDFINVLFEYVTPNTVRTISTVGSTDVHVIVNVKQNNKDIKRAIKYLQGLMKPDCEHNMERRAIGSDYLVCTKCGKTKREDI